MGRWSKREKEEVDKIVLRQRFRENWNKSCDRNRKSDNAVFIYFVTKCAVGKWLFVT